MHNPDKLRVLKPEDARARGFSPDRRKRRHEHRLAARRLMRAGTLLNLSAPIGSIPHEVARWHLFQARYL